MTDNPSAQNIESLSTELLEKARGSRSGRAAKGVFTGTYLRQAVLTLAAGAELADHDSPPEATLQVLKGDVRLAADDESWELTEGDLIAIPPQRHSVTALSDAAFMLTIRTDVGGA
ncbi:MULTISPECIES: cupin domain-containing protein [unclassified Brevibacterium]|uniref:cupin domain-containing protein n=1 Tax=unclassified Brevibacterium TaxID=2614124 RepID=UPI001091E9D0|nr:cupin domain-containing protein [Brevibacterium sp. S22]TGD31327.1 cupin domain-containing protein [Brevibacterium sp. S22]